MEFVYESVKGHFVIAVALRGIQPLTSCNNKPRRKRNIFEKKIMPLLVVNTNVSKDKIPANFVQELISVVAKTLGKSTSYVVVQVVPDQLMGWGGCGPSDACAACHLYSIGALGTAENKKHSAAISTLLQKTLAIPNDRCYIFFNNSNKADVGYQGTTFHDLL